MKIQLPIDNTKEYIITMWKDYTLAVFSQENFENYQTYINNKNNELLEKYLRALYRNAVIVEYDDGWEIPEELLLYMNYKNSIEIIYIDSDNINPIILLKAK